MSKRSAQPTFAAKRKQWLDVLSGKDQHSIINQVTQMAWDAAAFRVVNKARGLAPPDPEGGVQLNRLLHTLLDRSFFRSQMASVRRLMDTRKLRGQRSAYSLIALLKDMCKHRCLFTREAIFDAEGLEYDYDPIRQKADQHGIEQRRGGKSAYFVPTSSDSFVHEDRHEQIDRLTGVQAGMRQPRDTIPKAVFSNLQRKVQQSCSTIVGHVNTYIAHAGAPETVALLAPDERDPTLQDLWNAHRNLCEIAAFLGTYLLGHSCSPPLPIPQYDQFKYIERPLIDREQVGELQELWKQFNDDCHDWSQWGLDDYEREFGIKP